MSRKHQNSPDGSAKQQANELIGLIRKLRWDGHGRGGEESRGGPGAVRRRACRQRARDIARDGLTPAASLPTNASANGTSPPFAATQHLRRFRSETDVHGRVALTAQVVDDPEQTLGVRCEMSCLAGPH